MQAKKKLTIQKIYLKDLSWESPQSPMIFNQENIEKTSSNIDLNVDIEQVGEFQYQVVLHVTVSIEQKESTLFLVEVKQAGIFEINGFSEEELKSLLGAYCPMQLYPYAREVVSDVTMRGGFTPLLLDPVNFDALYQSRQDSID